MSLQLVRNFGAPRRFSAQIGSRPTILVRGRRGPVAMRAVTLRGLAVTPHTTNSVTIDVQPGVNTLRMLIDPANPSDVIETYEQNEGEIHLLHCHIFDPDNPVSGYRIIGEKPWGA